jgi:hypothetical protein
MAFYEGDKSASREMRLSPPYGKKQLAGTLIGLLSIIRLTFIGLIFVRRAKRLSPKIRHV